MSHKLPIDRGEEALDGIREYQLQGAGTFAPDVSAVSDFSTVAVKTALDARNEVEATLGRDDLPPDIKRQLATKAILEAEPVIADHIARSRLSAHEVERKVRETAISKGARPAGGKRDAGEILHRQDFDLKIGNDPSKWQDTMPEALEHIAASG